MEQLRLKFDAMASHDITFVGIIQTAKASGMERFPLPYVLTNCHNTLCAVGGTINEDDHMFGLSAARKYGGIYVPPHIAVIHQYMREMHAGCGKMILGSDSHTRYGALGTMAVGEGGGELVKQLLEDTYDVAYPGVVAVYLDRKAETLGWSPGHRSGHHRRRVPERLCEEQGHGVCRPRRGEHVHRLPQRRGRHDHGDHLPFSSIWRTDADTKAYLEQHGRGEDYKELNPADVAYYDGCVYVDLSTVKPMIALPFHPSNVYEIDELNANLKDILASVEKARRRRSPADGQNTPFWIKSKTVVLESSRASSRAAPAATTPTWCRLQTPCAARAAAMGNSASRSIPPASR